MAFAFNVTTLVQKSTKESIEMESANINSPARINHTASFLRKSMFSCATSTKMISTTKMHLKTTKQDAFRDNHFLPTQRILTSFIQSSNVNLRIFHLQMINTMQYSFLQHSFIPSRIENSNFTISYDNGCSDFISAIKLSNFSDHPEPNKFMLVRSKWMELLASQVQPTTGFTK